MKMTFGAAIGALGLAATLAGTTAMAQSATDQIVADLQGQGFTRIEIEEGKLRIEVEAIRGSEKLDVVFDALTGEIVYQSTEAVDNDDETAAGVFTELDDDDLDDDFDDDLGDDRDDDRDDDDRDDNDDHDDDDDDRDDDDNDDDNDDDDDDDDDGDDDDGDDDDGDDDEGDDD